MVRFPIVDYILTNPKDYNVIECKSDLAKGAEKEFYKYKLYCLEKEDYSFLDVPYRNDCRLLIFVKRIIKTGSRNEFSFIGIPIKKEYYQDRIDVLDLYKKLKQMDFDKICSVDENNQIFLDIECVNVNDMLQTDFNILSKYSIQDGFIVKEIQALLSTLYANPLDKWFESYSYSVNPDESVGEIPTDIVLTKKNQKNMIVEQESTAKNNLRISRKKVGLFTLVLLLVLGIGYFKYFSIFHGNTNEVSSEDTHSLDTVKYEDIQNSESDAQVEQTNASDAVTLIESENITDSDNGAKVEVLETEKDAKQEVIQDRK